MSWSLVDRANPTIGQYRNHSVIQIYLYTVFIALAWSNAIELVVLCLNTFKRYNGVYFWSLLIASASIIPFGAGYIAQLFKPLHTTNIPEVVITDVGWSGMVTGQSIVLWSRLHLVMHNRKVLRGILYMIIVNGVVWHITCTVLELGTNASSSPPVFAKAFTISERVQLVIFCLQELLMSGIYIGQTIKLLMVDPSSRSRGLLIQLLVINVVIILMDVLVVAIQYAGLFTFQVTIKALVYSVKLKLEYVILGRLVNISQLRAQGSHSGVGSVPSVVYDRMS